MSHASAALELLRWCGCRPSTGLGRSVTDDCAEFLRSRGIESLRVLASGVPDACQDVYDEVLREQVVALREALQALVDAGVRVLNFKGSELVPRHFCGRALGSMGDADLLVPRDQMEPARSVLYELGYRHTFFDADTGTLQYRDVAEVARIELGHYELAPFLRPLRLDDRPALMEVAGRHESPLYMGRDGPLAVMDIDVHHNVATDADVEPFFERAVRGSLGVGETLSSADHVWFNLSRYYNEVALHDKRSLRPLAYTLPEITSGEVDWDVVERVARELCLGPTLHYLLAFCDRLVPGHVPRSTLLAVKASTESRARDWGWQLGKLLDFEEAFPEQAVLDPP